MCNSWRTAKAEHGIDKKGVRLRDCGDGERSDSTSEVGRGSSFFWHSVAYTCPPGYLHTSYTHMHTRDDHPKAMYLLVLHLHGSLRDVCSARTQATVALSPPQP